MSVHLPFDLSSIKLVSAQLLWDCFLFIALASHIATYLFNISIYIHNVIDAIDCFIEYVMVAAGSASWKATVPYVFDLADLSKGISPSNIGEPVSWEPLLYKECTEAELDCTYMYSA